jgi:hypothetical protein
VTDFIAVISFIAVVLIAGLIIGRGVRKLLAAEREAREVARQQDDATMKAEQRYLLERKRGEKKSGA